MKNKLRPILIVCVIAGLAGSVDGQDQPSLASYTDTAIILIRKVNGELEKRAVRFSPKMKKHVDTYGYENFWQYYHDKFGKITGCTPPSILPGFAVFQLDAEKGRWSMRLGCDTDGSVAYLEFGDPETPIPVPERNAKPLRLPFRDEWLVSMGGSTPEQNYHIGLESRDIRCAVDFSKVDWQGRPYERDGKKNEDYYAFGKEILSAADGVVVAAIDGTPDNRPFTSNPLTISGNLIIIQHSDREFSRYFHLKMNSVRVKVDQKVSSGQVIAQCGNSGDSAASHLHFDLTNSAVPFDATGFAPYFRDVIVKREGSRSVVSDYTPLRNDSVQAREERSSDRTTSPAKGGEP